MNILEQIKSKITDPATLALVLKIVLDLASGEHRMSADTRLEIQAELDSITGGAL